MGTGTGIGLQVGTGTGIDLQVGVDVSAVLGVLRCGVLCGHALGMPMTRTLPRLIRPPRGID